ncbi:1446_t:CDS:2, partial [Racocetra fulgida]
EESETNESVNLHADSVISTNSMSDDGDIEEKTTTRSHNQKNQSPEENEALIADKEQ